jgi:hypothetical protein
MQYIRQTTIFLFPMNKPLARIIHDGSSAKSLSHVARPARGVLSLPVALFPPVSPVSLESGIGDCSRSVHE